MKLTHDQVIHIAKMARIHLADEEITKLIPEMNSILEMIQKLDNLNLDNVPQIDQITGLTNVMDEDKIQSFPNPRKLLQCSPQPIKYDMIEVKKSK